MVNYLGLGKEVDLKKKFQVIIERRGCPNNGATLLFSDLNTKNISKYVMVFLLIVVNISYR